MPVYKIVIKIKSTDASTTFRMNRISKSSAIILEICLILFFFSYTRYQMVPLLIDYNSHHLFFCLLHVFACMQMLVCVCVCTQKQALFCIVKIFLSLVMTLSPFTFFSFNLQVHTVTELYLELLGIGSDCTVHALNE